MTSKRIIRNGGVVFKSNSGSIEINASTIIGGLGLAFLILSLFLIPKRQCPVPASESISQNVISPPTVQTAPPQSELLPPRKGLDTQLESARAFATQQLPQLLHVSDTCKKELSRVCPDAARGNGQMLMCFTSHMQELGKSCADSIPKFGNMNRNGASLGGGQGAGAIQALRGGLQQRMGSGTGGGAGGGGGPGAALLEGLRKKKAILPKND